MPKEVVVAIATAKLGLKGVEAVRAPLNAAGGKKKVSLNDHEGIWTGDNGRTHYCGRGTEHPADVPVGVGYEGIHDTCSGEDGEGEAEASDADFDWVGGVEGF